MSGVQQSDRSGHLKWQKSTFSSMGNCVEVASDCGDIWLRDSKDPTGHWMRYTAAEWDAFLRGAKNGEFDHLP